VEMVLNFLFTHIYGGEFLNYLHDSFSRRTLLYVVVPSYQSNISSERVW